MAHEEGEDPWIEYLKRDAKKALQRAYEALNESNYDQCNFQIKVAIWHLMKINERQRKMNAC